MKVHITLVGAQTAPVYQGIKDTNAELNILIHSEQTASEANRIKSEIDKPCELTLFDPVDLPKIIDSVEKLSDRFYSEESVSINISGGTKLWSIFIYKAFSILPNTSIFYIDQNNKIWNLKDSETHIADFDMDAQFRLNGNPLSKYKSLTDFDERDFSSINEIKELRKKYPNDFNSLTAYLSDKSNINEHVLKSGSWLKWDSVLKLFNGEFITKNEHKTFQFQSKNIRNLLLNTGWFELEVTHIFSKWKYSKEIRLNCVFQTIKGSPKNEIDLIINTGNKLLFVECKTHIKKETDIDKFAAAVQNYGGSGSKAIFITESPMSNTAIEKCNDNKILHYSFINEDKTVGGHKKLFKLIEDEIFKTNIR
jgi:hypothetical protein